MNEERNEIKGAMGICLALAEAMGKKMPLLWWQSYEKSHIFKCDRILNF